MKSLSHSQIVLSFYKGCHFELQQNLTVAWYSLKRTRPQSASVSLCPGKGCGSFVLFLAKLFDLVDSVVILFPYVIASIRQSYRGGSFKNKNSRDLNPRYLDLKLTALPLSHHTSCTFLMGLQPI